MESIQTCLESLQPIFVFIRALDLEHSVRVLEEELALRSLHKREIEDNVKCASLFECVCV